MKFGPIAARERRRAFRVPIPDMSLRIKGRGGLFPACDLSVLGIGFRKQTAEFALGDHIQFDLMADGRVLLRALVAGVVRIETDRVGCAFEILDRQAENAIYELVLTRQKLLLDRG